MNKEILFDYGDDGKITVSIQEEEDVYEVYAKAYVQDGSGMDIPGTGIGDEGSF